MFVGVGGDVVVLYVVVCGGMVDEGEFGVVGVGFDFVVGVVFV